MSNDSIAAANSEVSAHTDILIPKTTDKVPIVCPNNRACIEGALYEVKQQYLVRKKLFQPLLKHRAVVLHSGKTVFDSVQSLQFYTGIASDSRSFDDPPPPTPARIATYETRSKSKFATLSAVPDAMKDSTVISEAIVEQEDAKFLTLLEHVFGQCDFSEKLIDSALGSGITFLGMLRDEARKAKPEDRTLVKVRFDRVVREGISGELDVGKVSAFVRMYKSHLRNLPPTQRPSAETEIEMVNHLVFKSDADTRRDYKAECRASPPSTLDEAVERLKDTLRDAKRCEEIDEEAHGGVGAKTDALSALLAKQAALESQLAALQAPAPADPSKQSGRRGGDKQRDNDDNKDAQGRPKEWRKGMQRCRCRIDEGKHPFHLCPVGGKTPAQRAAEAEKAAAAKGDAAPAGQQSAKLALDAQDQTAADNLAAQFEAFFASAEPAVDSTALLLSSADSSTGVLSAVTDPVGADVVTSASRASRRANNVLGKVVTK